MRAVYLMRAPPDSWLHTISIGRSPFYFSVYKSLGPMIVVFWESQMKIVVMWT